jgi:hypothetical protein
MGRVAKKPQCRIVKEPKRAREIAVAARAWQRLNKKSRCSIQDLAKKMRVSVKTAENAVKNPSKRLLVAEERLKLRTAIRQRAKKTKKRQISRDTATKIVRDLGLKTVSERTARRTRQETRKKLRVWRKGEKAKNGDANVEHARRQFLPKGHPDHIPWTNPVWWNR